MSYSKSIIIFAVSRKYSQYCVAGKTTERQPAWIRPVNNSISGELSSREITSSKNRIPKILDLAEIVFRKPQPKCHQTENHLINTSYKWTIPGSVIEWDTTRYLDHPDTLWLNSHDHSIMGINDRIHHNYIGKIDSSLLLIKPECVKLIVTHEYARKRVRANFKYNNICYQLCVTDPVYEKMYSEDGEYHIRGNIYFCISLGVNFNNYYYKLVAGIIKR